MRGLLCLWTACALFSPFARGSDGLRFFFDTSGVDERSARPTPHVLGHTNPTVTAKSGDPVRFYLYVEYLGTDQCWSADLDIVVSDPGIITDWQIYNRFGDSTRWNGIRNAAGANVQRISGINMISINRPGATNDEGLVGPPDDYRDDHFRWPIHDGGSATGTTLLGYIDVARGERGDAEVRLEVGRGRIATCGNGEPDPLHFGFCDEPVGEGGNRLWDARVSAGACDPCDVNCDGSVDLLDVAPFIDLLLGGGCACTQCAGDANGDGSIDLTDVATFIECLL